MACECASHHGTHRVADFKKFSDGKTEVGVSKEIHLLKCLACGQHWLVDQWKKFKEQLAFKIKSAERWEKMDTSPMRKAYIVMSAGGTTAQVCSVAGCKGHRLKKSTLCVDHVYAESVPKK